MTASAHRGKFARKTNNSFLQFNYLITRHTPGIIDDILNTIMFMESHDDGSKLLNTIRRDEDLSGGEYVELLYAISPSALAKFYKIVQDARSGGMSADEILAKVDEFNNRYAQKSRSSDGKYYSVRAHISANRYATIYFDKNGWIRMGGQYQ